MVKSPSGLADVLGAVAAAADGAFQTDAIAARGAVFAAAVKQRGYGRLRLHAAHCPGAVGHADLAAARLARRHDGASAVVAAAIGVAGLGIAAGLATVEAAVERRDQG